MAACHYIVEIYHNLYNHTPVGGNVSFPFFPYVQFHNTKISDIYPYALFLLFLRFSRVGSMSLFFQVFSILFWIALRKDFFNLNIHQPFSPPAISANALLKFSPV